MPPHQRLVCGGVMVAWSHGLNGLMVLFWVWRSGELESWRAGEVERWSGVME